MLSRQVPLVRSPEGRLGADGAILIGTRAGMVDGVAGVAGMVVGAGGTPDGVAGLDRSSGPTSSAISWPSRFGLTPISTPSGLTAICLSGTPYSGPVPITSTAQGMRMVQTIMIFTADTPTLARCERAPRVLSSPKSQAPTKHKPIWPRVAADSRPAGPARPPLAS